MITQIFLSCHLGRDENLKPSAKDARWTSELCRKNNVTGLTLYCDGDFFSVLEGSAEATEKVAKAIGAVPRINIAKVMYSEARTEREFREHSIGVDGADYSREVSGSFQLTYDSLYKKLPLSPSPVLRALTNSFARLHKFQQQP